MIGGWLQVRNPARLRLRLAAVMGLAIVVAAAFLLLGMIRFERAHNHSLNPAGDVHQVFVRAESPGAEPIIMPGTSVGLARDLRARQADLRVGRLAFPYDPQPLRIDDRQLFNRVAAADPELLEVLRLPTLEGDLGSVLERPEGAAVTREAGRRLFGPGPVVGRSFEVNGTAYVVGAVLADVHANSHLRALDVLVSGRNPGSSLGELDGGEGGGIQILGAVSTYVGLDRNTPVEALEALADQSAERLNRQYERTNPAAARLRQNHSLVALDDAGGRRRVGASPDPDRADPRLLAGAMAMAVLVLAGGLLNYTNFAVTLSIEDLREAALRKVYGADSLRLLVNGLTATCLWVGASVGLGFVLALVSARPFAALVDRSVDLALTPALVAVVAGVSAVIALAAALYPSLVISRAPPVAALGGRGVQPPGAGLLRKGLVVVQVASSVAMLGIGFIMWQQLDYATSRALGFVPDRFGAYRVAELIASDDPRTAMIASTLASAGADRVAFAEALPSEGALSMTRLGRPGGAAIELQRAGVSSAFLPLMGVDLVAGRTFTQMDETPAALSGSIPRSLVVTTSTAQALGFERADAAVGQVVQEPGGGAGFRIVGVIADVPMGGLRHAAPAPVAFSAGVERGRYIVLPRAAMQSGAVERAVQTLFADTPTDRFFMADRVAHAFADVRRLLGLVALFALLSGLTAFGGMATVSTLEGRSLSREASVRRVFGASRADIALFFSWRLASIALVGVGAGVLILLPAAYGWLQGFPDRFGSPSGAAVVSSLAVLLLLACAAAVQVLRTAVTPPATALHAE